MVFFSPNRTGTKQVYFGTRLLRAAQQHKERPRSTWGCDGIYGGIDHRLTSTKTYYTSSVSKLEFWQSTIIWNMLSGSLQKKHKPKNPVCQFPSPQQAQLKKSTLDSASCSHWRSFLFFFLLSSPSFYSHAVKPVWLIILLLMPTSTSEIPTVTGYTHGYMAMPASFTGYLPGKYNLCNKVTIPHRLLNNHIHECKLFSFPNTEFPALPVKSTK